MRAWIVTVAAVLTVIGISSPRVAGRSGHLLLITIGLAIAVVAVQPVFAKIEQRRAEPFVPTPPRTPRATMPNQMAQIVDAFTNRSERRRARRGSCRRTCSVGSRPSRPAASSTTTICTSATSTIIAEIQQLVSPTLWALLRPAEPGSTTASTLPAVPFDDLDRLLDELERL